MGHFFTAGHFPAVRGMDIGLPEYADGEPRGAVIKAHGSLAARSEQQIALSLIHI